jgi:Zn ribbon nucleic-acid-binding protein
MADWDPAVLCPQCGSDDTRFVEPHYEMSVYECLACGYRFEIEED